MQVEQTSMNKTNSLDFKDAIDWCVKHEAKIDFHCSFGRVYCRIYIDNNYPLDFDFGFGDFVHAVTIMQQLIENPKNRCDKTFGIKAI